MRQLLAAAAMASVSTCVQATGIWQLEEAPGGGGRHSPAEVERHGLRFAGGILAGLPATLDLDLPGRGMAARVDDVRAHPHGVTWRGHVQGDSWQQVVLTVHKGRLAGLLSLATETWEIVPVGEGRSLLLRIEQDRYAECAGSVPVSGGGGALPTVQPLGLEAPFRDRPGDIDVLVVYTPLVLAIYGQEQVEATILAAVANANAAFANSQIRVRFNLVGMMPGAFGQDHSLSAALMWLRTDPDVAAWRNELMADMVSVFVEGAEDGCGLGYLLEYPDDPAFHAWAFQATDYACAVGNLTYAHEHGHTMGMNHNPEAAGGGTVIAPDAFGHWYAGGTTLQENFRTVMSYACPGNVCLRRMFFSNPDLDWMGVPTGIQGERNNARIGKTTADLVANFRIKTIFRHGFD